MRWRSAYATALSLSLLLAAAVPAAADPAAPDQNLAQGKPYTVSSTVFDSRNAAYETTFPDDGTKLTDGVVGPAGWWGNGPWVGYLRQDYREIVVDLGAEQTIHKLSAHFLQDRAAGIRFPQEVSFAVSDNANAWANLGTVATDTPLSVSGARVQEFKVEGLNITGRYVRITFPTDVWVFLSEIQAWGQPGRLPGAQKPHPSPASPQVPQVPPRAGSREANGKKYQNLLYAGYYYNFNTTPIGKWTADQLLPYVAYLDENHQIKDFLFDSFLLMPFPSAVPSGKGSFETGGTLKSDWQFHIDYNFQPNLNIGALDQAVGQAKAALNRPDYKVKLSVAIPFAGLNSDWGDGLDFNPANVGAAQSTANRLAAVQWYVDYVKAKFAEGGYANLELNGFYWYNEAVPYGLSPNEEEFIRGASQIVHHAGPYAFEWIPFSMSEGYRKWRELGFDTALQQPNLFFGGFADRLDVTAQLSRRHGLGMEMEMDYAVLTPSNDAARAKYYAYLDNAVDNHFQNSFFAWYQAYNILLSAERSAYPRVRALYDDTYKFIKGTYKPTYRPGPGDTGSSILHPVGTPGEQDGGPAPKKEPAP